MKRLIFTALVVALSAIGVSAQQQLTLDDAIAIGLKENYGVLLSKLDSKSAEQNIGWGAAGAYPTVTGSANYSVSPDLVSNETSAGLTSSVDAQMVLFDGYNIRLSKKINDYKYELTRGAEAVQIENTVYDITIAYNYYILSRELLAVYQTVYTLSKDIYDRDKMAYDLGGKQSYEIIQSESAYLADYQNYIKQEKELRNAMYQLNLVMGVDIYSKWSINQPLNTPNGEYALGQLIDAAMSSNSNLKNQYINLKIAESALAQTKGARYPTLLGAMGMRYNDAFSGANNRQLQPYAGVTVNATIFSGGAVNRAINIAKINSEIANIEIEQLKSTVTKSISQQYDEYTYNSRLFSIATRALEVSKANLDISYEKLSNGTINSFNYRDVQLQYIQQAYNKFKITFDIIVANLELSRLTGGIVSE